MEVGVNLKASIKLKLSLIDVILSYPRKSCWKMSFSFDLLRPKNSSAFSAFQIS